MPNRIGAVKPNDAKNRLRRFYHNLAACLLGFILEVSPAAARFYFPQPATTLMIGKSLIASEGPDEKSGLIDANPAVPYHFYGCRPGQRGPAGAFAGERTAGAFSGITAGQTPSRRMCASSSP
jgi:hypothetical protein